jgi:hypothetical protein
MKTQLTSTENQADFVERRAVLIRDAAPNWISRQWQN